MAEKPITFTEQEQLNLRDLENSGNEILQFKNAVLKGSFPGELSPAVFGLANFLESLIQQAMKQISNIKENAAKRQKDAEASIAAASPAPSTSVEQ